MQLFFKKVVFGESDSYEEGSHLWIVLSSPVVREELCLTVQNWSASSSTSAETWSLILWSASEPAKCLSYHPKLSPPLQNTSKEDGFCVTITLLSFEMCFFCSQKAVISSTASWLSFLILCYHWFCDSTSSIFCIHCPDLSAVFSHNHFSKKNFRIRRLKNRWNLCFLSIL